jgi:diaminopimelate decarboxylase
MFHYKNNSLQLDSLQVTEIAKQVGTPFYLYSISCLKENFLQYQKAFMGQDMLICFAVKANSNLSILNALGKLGAGADCVSEGEIRKSIAAGIASNKIVFSGVGKTEQELNYAISQNIFQFNIESIPELLLLNKIAASHNKIVNIALRINADIDSKTHYKINTGLKCNKFGIHIDELSTIIEPLQKLTAINLQGLSIHIGSQITTLEPYKKAYKTILEIAKLLESLNCKISYLDLGGGLGVRYDQENPPTIIEYSEMVKSIFRDSNYKFIIEPGRSLVADIGILVSKVIYIKSTQDKKFAIIDAGMNDILRQSLYDAYHDILPLTVNHQPTTLYDVVGPVCETSDVFIRDKNLQMLSPNDLIAFKHAGAYGAVMSSTYNSRLLIPEVIAQNTQFAITKPRLSYEDMLKAEIIPNWI